jgi:hypothetical protein
MDAGVFLLEAGLTFSFANCIPVKNGMMQFAGESSLPKLHPPDKAVLN